MFKQGTPHTVQSHFGGQMDGCEPRRGLETIRAALAASNGDPQAVSPASDQLSLVLQYDHILLFHV